MPNPPTVHTLLDVQMHSVPALDKRIVEDVILEAPVFSKLPARTISGATYKFIIRTEMPKSGFRPANKGVGVHKSGYRQEVGQCFILDGQIVVDKAVLLSDERGENALLFEEAKAKTAGTLFALEQQLFYGKKIDPNGFDGFEQGIGDYMTISADPNKNVPDSILEESGASVWAVVNTPETLEIVYGNKKGISFGPVKEEHVQDDEGKTFAAKTIDMMAFVGMTVRSEFALARLRNEDANHPLTDAKLADLISLFPARRKPSFLVMTRATLARLQKSRAAQLTYTKKTSGQTAYAETPTEFEGIPIIVTDALLDDETPENIAAAAKAALVAKKNTSNPLR